MLLRAKMPVSTPDFFRAPRGTALARWSRESTVVQTFSLSAIGGLRLIHHAPQPRRGVRDADDFSRRVLRFEF